MAEVGAFEAKTHLPKLLERVQKGERIVITKHGRPVAELVPVERRDPQRIRKAIAQMRALRAKLSRRGLTLKRVLQKGETARELAHEGHRF